MVNASPITGHRKLILPGGDLSIRPFQEGSTSANQPPEFSRSPRDFVPYPDEVVTLQLPPPMPSLPSASLLTIMLPAIGMVVMVGFTIFASSFASESKQIPIYAFVSLPMALISVLGGVLNHRREKKKYDAQVQLRQKSVSAVPEGNDR